MCVIGDSGPRWGELLDENCGVCSDDMILFGTASAVGCGDISGDSCGEVKNDWAPATAPVLPLYAYWPAVADGAGGKPAGEAVVAVAG